MKAEIRQVLLIKISSTVDCCLIDLVEESCMEEVGGWVGGGSFTFAWVVAEVGKTEKDHS